VCHLAHPNSSLLADARGLVILPQDEAPTLDWPGASSHWRGAGNQPLLRQMLEKQVIALH
jgi:hypothetical protein